MKIYFFLITFLSAFHCISQDFKGGISIGAVASQVDGDFYSGYHKTGFLFGGFINRKLSDQNVLQIELRYIQKGSHHRIDPNIPGSTYYKMRLNYAEIPVLFQYIYKNKYIIDVGPSVGVLFASLEEGINSSGQLITSHENNFKRFEYAIQGGVQLKLSANFSAAFRAGYSLVPIRGNNANIQLAMRGAQYNNLLTCILYYQF